MTNEECDLRSENARLRATIQEAAQLTEQAEIILIAHADKLRLTASQLRKGEDEKAGGINRYHCAARLEKMAIELMTAPKGTK